ncbi:hypothetical protein GCM10023189_24870 [Nibrella saemangeumensis]|uniref:Tetratricopeptide repeat-containing protein n=1 Tax=Nibrella saemangeumensis TaxID=1084526 RepID=A0ABP8MWI0_9BACT
MKKFGLWLLLWMPTLAQGQILTDKDIQQTILSALDNIYNYEFDEAEPFIRQVRNRYPQHPVAPMLKAIQIQWQYLPLTDNRNATVQYTQYLTQSLELAKKLLDKDKKDPEGVFFALTAHGYLALKYHYDEEFLKGVSEAKKAYGYLIDGFNLMEKNGEFYFTTGLYNYYVERYPEDHPVVKPFMFFFQSGNMQQGLRQMETSVKRGLFTRPEASYYLAQIFLKNENQPNRASLYSKWLVDKYPNNPLYRMRHAEALLLAGRYNEAEPHIERLRKSPVKILPMAVKVFEGLLLEKEAKNDKAAAESYQAALRMPFDVANTKEYHAFAYAGLARIAARAGNRNQAKAYYKKAADMAEYRIIHQEAKAYSKS